MSTDIYDIYQEIYETDLFRKLNGIIGDLDEDKSDYSDGIVAILSLHIYMETKMESAFYRVIKTRLGLKDTKKLQKIIVDLGFKQKINIFESMEIFDHKTISYLNELNAIRNKIAHEDSANKIKFFGEELLTTGGFEKLKDKTSEVLKILSESQS